MHRLLETLARSVAAYLAGQAAAGAQALMVFDTWGGLLAPALFREFSLRWLGEIVALLKADPVARELPVILFSKGANAHLEALADTGCAALGVDWTIAIGEARARVGDRVALQGNLDPVVLAAAPTPSAARSARRARRFRRRIRATCSISVTASRRTSIPRTSRCSSTRCTR